MRVKDEGKLSYSVYHFIDNTAKIDGKIQEANCFIETKLMCILKQVLVNFCRQRFRYGFEVFITRLL